MAREDGDAATNDHVRQRDDVDEKECRDYAYGGAWHALDPEPAGDRRDGHDQPEQGVPGGGSTSTHGQQQETDERREVVQGQDEHQVQRQQQAAADRDCQGRWIARQDLGQHRGERRAASRRPPATSVTAASDRLEANRLAVFRRLGVDAHN